MARARHDWRRVARRLPGRTWWTNPTTRSTAIVAAGGQGTRHDDHLDRLAGAEVRAARRSPDRYPPSTGRLRVSVHRRRSTAAHGAGVRDRRADWGEDRARVLVLADGGPRTRASIASPRHLTRVADASGGTRSDHRSRERACVQRRHRGRERAGAYRSGRAAVTAAGLGSGQRLDTRRDAVS